MAELTGPLMSLLAQGTLISGFTLQQRRGKTHTTRSRPPTLTRTRKQVAQRYFLSALAQAWHDLAPADRLDWNQAIPEWGKTTYHAYLAFNWARLKNDQHPLTAYGATPPGSPPTMGFSQANAGPQRLTARAFITAGNAPRFILFYHVPPAPAFISARAAQYWFAEHNTTSRWLHATHVPPATYALYVQAVDQYGRPGNARLHTALVVTP